MKNKILPIIKTAVLVGGLMFGSVALAAWTAPSSTAPACPSSVEGCNQPINIGSSMQQKTGPLNLGVGTPSSSYPLDVLGTTFTTGLINSSGSRLAGNTAIGAPIAAPAPSAILSVGSQELLGGAASTTFKTFAGTLGSAVGSTLNLGNIGFGYSSSTSSTSGNGSFGIHAARVGIGSSLSSTAVGIGMDIDGTQNYGGGSIWFNSLGNLGINTISPIQKLDVNGNVKANGFCLGTSPCITSWSSGGSSSASYWNASGADIYKTNTGNVGIGTATPARTLTLSGGPGTELLLENTSMSANNKRFNVYLNADQTNFRALNDAGSGGLNWMTVNNTTGAMSVPGSLQIGPGGPGASSLKLDVPTGVSDFGVGPGASASMPNPAVISDSIKADRVAVNHLYMSDGVPIYPDHCSTSGGLTMNQDTCGTHSAVPFGYLAHI